MFLNIHFKTYLHVIHRQIKMVVGKGWLFYFYRMAFTQLDLFGAMAMSAVEDSKITVEQVDNDLIVNENTETYTDTITEVTPEGNLVVTKGKRGRKSNKEIYAGVNQMGIPDDEELRMKLYHPIRQVAKWFGVPASQIRFWENQFEVLTPRKNRKGDRLFRFEDIQYLKTIYYLIRIRKFSIEGAREYLKENKVAIENNYSVIESLTAIKGFLMQLKESLNHA